MEQEHDEKSNTPPKIDSIAVAVCLCDRDQRHVGLVYQDNSNTLRLLGLSFTHLANDPWNPSGYLWFIPDLERRDLLYLRAQANAIADADGRYVPYGFSDPRECFDEQTARFLCGSRVGLTCATFVLAVFEFSSIRLIDYESWEQREDDVQWQTYVIGILDHLWRPESDLNERRRAEIGNLRYRPEEVAAASDLFPPSVRFEDARPVAEEIVANLNNP